MNILICEDNLADAKKLMALLNDSDFNVNTTVFHSGREALEYVHSGAMVDVCFLDIFMPEMTGIVLAEKLRADGFTGELVFLTTSNEFAAESYNVQAFAYLLKPPMPDALRSVMCDLENARKESDTDGIMVKTKSITRFILLRDISYVEVMNHHVYFRLKNGDNAEMNTTLSEITQQLLCDSRFAQCHQSFIVNLSDISAIGKEITMRSGARLPISKSYSGVKNKYLQWGLGGDRK